MTAKQPDSVRPMRLQNYTPVMPSEYWEVIEPFVTQVVEAATPHVSYTEKQLYAVTARLTLWAWQAAALPLEVDVVFSSNVIDRFTDKGMPQYTKAGRNTMRARLRRMSDALLGPDRDPDRPRPMGSADASRPYSQREVASLMSWAAGQPRGDRNSSALTLLSLGLGAGLTGREIAQLKIGDIRADEGGVVITVQGERARQVPVLRHWESALVARSADRDSGDWAFREGQEGGNRNLVSDFAARTYGGYGPQARRMHATWIVAHLEMGTPLGPLLRAAGLKEPEALGRFLPFVCRVSVEDERALLRG